jgi:tetratricopeptide (TPR) repeat protein
VGLRLAGALIPLGLALGVGAAFAPPAPSATDPDPARGSGRGIAAGTSPRWVSRPDVAGLQPPRLDPGREGVHWPVRGDSETCGREPRLLDDLRARRTPEDSIRAWVAAGEADSLLEPLAFTEAARLWLALGDSACADSLLGRAVGQPSLWQWRALQQRARLALSLAGTARADSILEGADRTDWPDGDRVAWLEQRIALRAGLGDSAQAIEFSRQAIWRYPSLPAAGRILRGLERMLAARGGSLGVEDERAAAEVDFWRGDRVAAAHRLERAFAQEAGPERWHVALRRGEVLRMGRRFEAALEVLGEAAGVAPDPAARARIQLERARVHRDAGAWSEAEQAFASAAAGPDTAARALALWEGARALEGQGAWGSALAAYSSLARSPGARADDAAFRAGLVALASGQPDTAQTWFGRSVTEGARFWRAVLLRRTSPAGADSILAAIARAPGYSFYRVAARDTLGLAAGPPQSVAEGSPATGTLLLVKDLLVLGRESDARLLLRRWAAEDPRLRGPGGPGPVVSDSTLLRAAALAYAAGWNSVAIGLASRAMEGLAESSLERRWSVAPWLYPPAFDSAFVALPESLTGSGPDRALLHALVWQESRFDPAARSRSNALGLAQLKLGTAREEAHRLGEGMPREEDLFDPVRSVRYGSAYLQRLMARFRKVHCALAAYNAGPGAVAKWAAIWAAAPGRELGGDALECEVISRPETEDFVKSILAVRQAYRELRPTTAP